MHNIKQRAEMNMVFERGVERLAACLNIYKGTSDLKTQVKLLNFMNTHCTPELLAITKSRNGGKK